MHANVHYGFTLKSNLYCCYIPDIVTEQNEMRFPSKKKIWETKQTGTKIVLKWIYSKDLTRQ